MEKAPRYLLVESDAAPEVFLKVLGAKRLLASGAARSVNEAARRAGLSRSAFYKYKDKVHAFNEMGGRVATFNAQLRDEAGVLSRLTAQLYRCGANILTISQNMPADGIAPVSVAAGLSGVRLPMDDMLRRLRSVDGVKSVDVVMGV